MTRERYSELGKVILDSAITVHRELGPGLLESVYQFALLKEFDIRGIRYVQKAAVPLFYKGFDTAKYFEIDILVEGEIILELKAIEIVLPVHEAQLLTYLKLANKKLGYIINFNVPLLKDGFRRRVLNY